MKITVKVKPNARNDNVQQLENGQLLVNIAAPPKEGKANDKLIEVLSKYFHRSKRDFTIILGKNSRNKVIEVK